MLRRSQLSRTSRLRRLAIVTKRRYTGPSPKVRALVRTRANHCCEWPGCGRVGTDYHHRLGRKMGGRFGARAEELNRASWIVYACREHHDQVTSAAGVALSTARAMGWVLTEECDASDPIHTCHGWVVLGNAGSFEVLP